MSAGSAPAGLVCKLNDTVVYCASLAVNRRYRFSNKQIAVNGVKIINLIARMTVSVSHLHVGVISWKMYKHV